MSAIDIGLYSLYVFIIIAIGSAIVLPFISLFANPKGLVKGGVAILIILIIFFIGYATASSDVTPKYIALGVDAQGVKFIGAGLTLLYVFIIGSLCTIVFSELSKIFR
jgi:hypothetical protein